MYASYPVLPSVNLHCDASQQCTRYKMKAVHDPTRTVGGYGPLASSDAVDAGVGDRIKQRPGQNYHKLPSSPDHIPPQHSLQSQPPSLLFSQRLYSPLSPPHPYLR